MGIFRYNYCKMFWNQLSKMGSKILDEDAYHLAKKSLKNLAQNIDMSRSNSASDFLKELRKSYEESYKEHSLEEFAALLGLSSSALAHHYISGRRGIKPGVAESIAQNLGLVKLKKKIWYCLAELSYARSTESKEEINKKLLSLKSEYSQQGINKSDSVSYRNFFRDWVPAVVFEILANKQVAMTIDEIQAVSGIKITRPRIKQALEILTSLEALEVSKSQENKTAVATYRAKMRHLDFGDGVAELEAELYHLSVLDLAKVALGDLHYLDREFSSLTLSVKSDDKKEIFRRTTEFLRSLASEFDIKEADDKDVLQVNLQMFKICGDSKE